MRKIIIPTDFSENAFNALKYAVDLFKYEISEIIILHAFADEVYNTQRLPDKDALEILKQEVLKKSNASLSHIEKQLKDYSPNPRHRVKSLSAFGILVDEVNDLINSENADIVVMGTQGETDDKNITFGTNTLQVIKHVQCPVLCIPADCKYKTPKNILFPTNYMIPYQRRELKLIVDMARSFRTTIHMLYVSNFPVESFRQKDNQLFLKEQFYEIRFKFHLVEETDRVEAIKTAIDEMDIDMLIMVNSHHTFLEEMLHKHTIDKIGLHPKIPFMILQNYHRDVVTGLANNQ
ncbi:universal stress protein [Gillisia sp. M10.2A]|uniref:Universal stress protein n=1 Tax=Gillisia lutea TaxID=2909668 RepID=A0ABS9EIM6_9FLAO|nr:universal stress protein [Gillisia lutea]MCF4102717.1 universal stress protein [Gillisia lutea]